MLERKKMAPRLTDRDATLSARRVCCPCLGHMRTSVFVIDRGSRTRQRPNLWQCGSGKPHALTLRNRSVTALHREDAHTMQGFRKFPEALIPESRES